MTEHLVRIALPLSAVHQAWRLYSGHEAHARSIRATFAVAGPEATVVTIQAEHGDAPATECLHGFLSYVDAAYEELDRHPGTTSGDAPVGPDGTSHMGERPLGACPLWARSNPQGHGEPGSR